MENILRVFVGQHIIGLGSPIIIHTGWSQPIGRLYSEYFLIFRGDAQFYKSLRMGFEYAHPAPHPVKRDVMLLMEHTYDEAMTSVYEYLAKHYKALEISNPHNAMQLKEVPATYLLRMHIFGVQAEALKAVQLESTSPRLRTTLKRFFGVPPLIPIP